jgi:hypothetical protein
MAAHAGDALGDRVGLRAFPTHVSGVKEVNE